MKILFKFIKFSYNCYKTYFLVAFFKIIILASLTIYNAYSLSILISYLEASNYQSSLICGEVLVSINLVFAFLNKYIEKASSDSEERMNEEVTRAIAYKLTNLPYQYLEDPYYLDLKEKAKMSVENFGSVYRILSNFGEMIKNIIILIGLASIMAMFDFVIVIILISAVLFNLLIIFFSLKTQRKLFVKLIPINRKFEFYIDTLLEEKNGKDFRNYPIKKVMVKQFDRFTNDTCSFFKKIVFATGAYDGLNEVVKYVQIGIVYALVGIKTLVNRLPISTFTLYFSSAISFSQTITSIIANGGALIQTVNYLASVIELMELPEPNKEGIELKEQIKTIEFRNVSFSYPKSDNEIIKNLSFRIEEKEKISIVGLNGAGKTTLVKLLSRLYKPTSGTILVNNHDINEYQYDSYIFHLSAVFQDFKLFAYTIKENVLCGKSDNDEIAIASLSSVGFKNKLDSLPDGINTLYTKSYDEKGIELSGGEAQKVAIARAVASNSDVVILDEPTSALDPLAEAEIYESFNKLVDNRIAIYISHRMSSSIFCDKILVLDGGTQKDYDTHHNLMKKTDSLYYKLFMAQANNYRID